MNESEQAPTVCKIRDSTQTRCDCRQGVGDVTGNTSTDLEDLITRLRQGDAVAKSELLERAYHRLLRIAATILNEDFADLRRRHELESVVSEAWIRLRVALEATQPETVDGFFGLVFTKVRQVLLDMAKRERKDELRRRPPQGDESDPVRVEERADSTNDPGRLALLTECHEQVEKLPFDERIVFELRYYGGFSQAEIAQILELQPKQVSRRWLAATGQLARWLGGSAESI
jgi:RNA polymerase sigma factor (sigma-70 family)